MKALFAFAVVLLLSVNVFAQTNNSDCNTNGFTTFTPGGWGSPSNSTPGGIRDTYFSTVFPNGLTVGGHYTLKLTSAQNVQDFLPSGGTPASLTQNYLNPGSSLSNTLAGHLVSITLAVEFNKAGVLGTNPTKLGDLLIATGTFTGMTVNDFLALANAALGGGSTNYSLSQFTSAATSINENFDNGTVNKNFLKCPNECRDIISSYVYHDVNGNGIKDAGESGIAGVVVELLSGSTLISTSTTDITGKYSFINLSNGTYTVRLGTSNFAAGGVFYSTAQTKWYSKSSASVNTTLNCNDDLSISFGYYKTCVSIIKSSDKSSYTKGETITYSFQVENCGDLQLKGVDVFDAMLNPAGNHLIKHIDVLNPGQSLTFTMTYITSDKDCGQLTNTVRAEGHPTDGSTVECNTQGFTTFTPGGWGSPSNSVPGGIRDQYFSTVFPNGLTVGGTYTIKLTSAAAVQEFLPSSGAPAQLNQNYINPGTTVSNTLAGHLVSLTLAVKFNEAGVLGTNSTKLGDLIIASGDFAGMTVNQFLVLANAALGGGSTNYSLSQFTAAATAMNENFDNGTVDNGFLTCVTSSVNYAVVTDESSLIVNIICDEKADIKIEKTVDNQNPKCDENVTFTIKATNLGPNTANGIQVTDLLPNGLNYISYTASQGTYTSANGIWNVGTLANGAFATLTVTVKVDCGQVNGSSIDLGPAKEYNLFVLEDASQPSSDTQGKVAVGHNAQFSLYSVGDQLPANSGDVLIVGNDLTYTSGAIYNGNVVYGHSTNLPIDAVSITGGVLRKDDPIDFAAAKTYLENLSTTLSAKAATGTTTLQWGGINLNGSDPYLNVFSVNGSDLSLATNVAINVPNGSVVLVNINGTTLTWQGGLTVTGTSTTNVLFNFYQATSLTIRGIDITGSVLAPFAAVNFEAGVINGQMICKSLTGMGQFNSVYFRGQIPIDKKITNIATVTASSVTDPVQSNNSASATVNATNASSNTGSTGNNGTNWSNISSFGPGEIVYSFAYGTGGTIYAGTWGGKIYKSTDSGKTWVVINTGMNVSFIWSLNISGGFIFAATEQGVYKYNGTSWVLTSLSGKDVHSIVSYNGIIYAATWGSGVYKSTNNGDTWIQINSGIENYMTVQTLTVTSGGTVFAGTVGGGLFKCTDGKSWLKLTGGYSFVWSLNSTSSVVFSGTYGDGLYKSVDGGTTFTKVTSLNISFVYSISVDLGGKIYVSSLTNGVYVSSDNGLTWTSLGMSGNGVSAMMVNQTSSDLIIGTKEGKLFKIESSNGTTGVEDNAVIPTEYKLEQNYPNPFNPTTTIQFSIPENGVYNLKVYNILGEEVASLINGQLTAGVHKTTFDASKIASGVYIYRLSGGKVNISKKMILMK